VCKVTLVTLHETVTKQHSKFRIECTKFHSLLQGFLVLNIEYFNALLYDLLNSQLFQRDSVCFTV